MTQTPNTFDLVLENYDSNDPPVAIMITSGSTFSDLATNYWSFNSANNSITQESPTAGDTVGSYFFDWSSLPDYTGAASQISGQTGQTPVSRKYISIPAKAITAARIWICKSKIDNTQAPWSGWLVSGNSTIPAFAEDPARLTSNVIVDKVEFTYTANFTLTINTTTVDYLSIPMTVEGIFNISQQWGNIRGPVGITKSMQDVAAAFTNTGTKGGVDWSHLLQKDSVRQNTYDRVVAPNRYMTRVIDSSNQEYAAWNDYFDDYIVGLTTMYTNGDIHFPFDTVHQPQGYFVGRISVSGGKWVIDALDQTGRNVVKSALYTIDPSDLTGNSLKIWGTSNVDAIQWGFYAALNRGVAHLQSDRQGWADIFGTKFPTVEQAPGTSWTPSNWTNAADYYQDGSFNPSPGTTIAYNVYSQLLHENSIIGSYSNNTVSAFPTAVNNQQFCFGFSVDDVWMHPSEVHGQGPNAGVGTTISATIGIFSQT